MSCNVIQKCVSLSVGCKSVSMDCFEEVMIIIINQFSIYITLAAKVRKTASSKIIINIKNKIQLFFANLFL